MYFSAWSLGGAIFLFCGFLLGITSLAVCGHRGAAVITPAFLAPVAFLSPTLGHRSIRRTLPGRCSRSSLALATNRAPAFEIAITLRAMLLPLRKLHGGLVGVRNLLGPGGFCDLFRKVARRFSCPHCSIHAHHLSPPFGPDEVGPLGGRPRHDNGAGLGKLPRTLLRRHGRRLVSLPGLSVLPTCQQVGLDSCCVLLLACSSLMACTGHQEAPRGVRRSVSGLHDKLALAGYGKGKRAEFRNGVWKIHVLHIARSALHARDGEGSGAGGAWRSCMVPYTPQRRFCRAGIFSNRGVEGPHSPWMVRACLHEAL